MGSNNLDGEVLDPFLQSFLDAEASAPLPDGAEQRVLSGVLQTLSVAPVGAGVAVTSIAMRRSLLLVASAVVGVVVGVVVDRTLLAEEPGPVSEPLPTRVAAPTIDTGVEVRFEILALDAGPSDKTKPNPRSAKSVVERAQTPIVEPAPTPLEVSPRAREAHLIDRARAALRRGLLDDALIALMQHERTFAVGQLAEERDVLIIETYVAKGSLRIARRRIERYRKSFPNGFHRSRVDHSESGL